MSVMERRLQLLLDQTRYDRVAAEAERSGRSVAAVIREAIDQRFPSGDQARLDALGDFLALTENPVGERGQSWEEIKAELADRLDEELSR
jgi:predicted RNA-binding Zn ribbon-like protein